MPDTVSGPKVTAVRLHQFCKQNSLLKKLWSSGVLSLDNRCYNVLCGKC